MRRDGGLAREIMIRMALVTLGALAVAAVCAFLVYLWVFENHPNAVPAPDRWVPELVDFVAIAFAIALALALSFWAGRSLARRIVLPLTSLALAARRITGGDLSARAVADDRSLGETASLVDDFNSMAARLEDMADGMVAWNAAIAHELRTPVTILKGRLQGVWDGVFVMDDATQISLLKQIDQLSRLVEDLRIVSLADTERLHLQIESVDLAQVVGELREAVEPDLKAAGFLPQWTLEPVVVTCDATRVRQAVSALIENVRTHATPGPITVGVGRHDAHAVLSVEDSGPGLAPGFALRAFDPFHRNPHSAKGSGLGLSVVRAIVDAHGGQVRCQPGALGGSRFEIDLPIQAVAPVARPDQAEVFHRYLYRPDEG